jgi:hypothetical protein
MFNGKENNVGVTPPAAPEGTAPASAPVAPSQPFTFSVNGSSTTDFAAVQAHITQLEAFRSETTKANRHSYIEMLAHSNRILGTKVDAFKAHVENMSADQFTAFKGLYGEAEPEALVSRHATAQETGAAPAAPASKAVAPEIVILREQVAMHQAAGTPARVIQGMESYKSLIALDPSFKL